MEGAEGCEKARASDIGSQPIQQASWKNKVSVAIRERLEPEREKKKKTPTNHA